MKKSYYSLIIFSVFLVGVSCSNLCGQQLRNAATITVPEGTTMRITGGLVIESTGDIDLQGTIELKGNWENHREGLELYGGTVKFISNPGQLINGSHITTFNDVTIVPNSVVVLNEGMFVNINGIFDNQNNNAGFVMEPGTSLKHYTSNVPATIKNVVNGNENAWHMLSSPVVSQGIETGFNDGSFYAWNEPYQAWVNYGSTYYPTWSIVNSGLNSFIPGKGYMTAYPYVSGQPQTKVFTGNMNVGPVSFTLDRKAFATDTYLGFNQLGNPYPSSIDWKATSGWSGREHLAVSGGYNVWVWNNVAGNYGAYNSASEGDQGTNNMSRYIAPMQAFWVRAGSAGDGQTIAMDNAVRVHSSQQWLKSIDAYPGILRLAVNGNANAYRDEVSIEFGHTQDIGGAEKMFSFYASAPSLYTVKENINWSISFLTEINEHPVVPVGFKAGADAVYEISATGAEYFTDVILEDLQTGFKQNLASNPVYQFSAKTGDKADRFLLHFMAVGIDQPDAPLPKIFYSEQQLHIFNPWPGKAFIQVFDASGRLTRGFDVLGQGLHHFSFRPQPGIYIVKLFNETQIHTTKIIVN